MMRPTAMAVPASWADGDFGRPVAVLLWLSVAGEETVERGLRVPLEFQQVPPGLELTGEPPTLVDVRLRGSGRAR